jgi:hypothetical protein
MEPLAFPESFSSAPSDQPWDLQHRVLLRTGWRISNLLIEMHPGHAVLRGRATTHFARLLAQQAVQDLLPNLRLDNAIEVDHDGEVLTGMPLH